MAGTEITNVGSRGNLQESIASEYTLQQLLATFKANAGLSEKQSKAIENLGKNFKPGKQADPASTNRKFKSLGAAADALEGSLKSIPKHFENFDEVLDKHSSYLKKGGTMFILVPNMRNYVKYYKKAVDNDNLKIHNLN